jgi:2-polyprenyl-3-methyl-5-hydroxy-6-metoxy-1,4-benzoquinol methylase
MLATPGPSPLKWDDETLSRFWSYYSQFPELYFSYQKGRDVVAYVRNKLPAGASVLDYGCGPGHLLPHLLDAGFVVNGADITLDTIGSAVSLEGYGNFKGFDTIDGLLRKGQQFDVVFLLEVIEHLDDDWLDKTLRQARGLLKKGGLLIVTTPNEERLEDSMVYCPVANVTFHRWQHMRSWSAASLAQTLAAHGFNEVSVETRNFEAAGARNHSYVKHLLSKFFDRFRKAQSIVATARA